MPRQYNFKFGGENFGFNVPTALGEGAKAETESVLADYFPELTFKIGAKSQRGSRLGRSTAATEQTVTLKPAPIAAPTPAVPAPAAASAVPTPVATAAAPAQKQPVVQPEVPKDTLTPEQQQIRGYYQQYLGRNPVQKEIADWQGTGKSMSEIQTGLSQHSMSTQGTQSIKDWYQSYLGRPAAEQEVKDWQGTGYGLEAIKQNLMEIGKRQKA